jgi:hypothetical protein
MSKRLGKLQPQANITATEAPSPPRPAVNGFARQYSNGIAAHHTDKAAVSPAGETHPIDSEPHGDVHVEVNGVHGDDESVQSAADGHDAQMQHPLLALDQGQQPPEAEAPLDAGSVHTEQTDESMTMPPAAVPATAATSAADSTIPATEQVEEEPAALPEARQGQAAEASTAAEGIVETQQTQETLSKDEQAAENTIGGSSSDSNVDAVPSPAPVTNGVAVDEDKSKNAATAEGRIDSDAGRSPATTEAYLVNGVNGVHDDGGSDGDGIGTGAGTGVDMYKNVPTSKLGAGETAVLEVALEAS